MPTVCSRYECRLRLVRAALDNGGEWSYYCGPYDCGIRDPAGPGKRMKTICGNETSHPTRWAKVFVLITALGVAVPAIGTSDARADPAPAPQKLWRQFPLDAPGHSTSTTSNAGAATATTSERRGDGTPMSAAVWAATAGAVVAALLAVAVIAGRLRVRLPFRPRRRPEIRERVAELVDEPQPTNGGRTKPRRVVRTRSWESEQAVLKRKGATLSADADAKLRAKSQNGSRDHELVLLKAKQERKP